MGIGCYSQSEGSSRNFHFPMVNQEDWGVEEKLLAIMILKEWEEKIYTDIWVAE